jgi:demethylmenaquinone methyltransferase / 2-methoxy-6-polyprenyl-1,4-benzoquinol methylase
LVDSEKVLLQRKPLYGIFTDIPRHYDLINTVFTWGMDRGWRNKTARECLAKKPDSFLDLCCGTGDLAITVAGMADYPLEIKGLDYSQPMLDIAVQKAATLKTKRITFIQGEASKIPFSDAYFDCVGISFAFRNLTYQNPLVEKHLSEIVRILKPGGRCIIAESAQPRSHFIQAGYHFYMQQYTYRNGALISGNKPAYRYLADSTCRYYSPPELQEFLVQRRFTRVSWQNLLFGAGAIYTATK